MQRISRLLSCSLRQKYFSAIDSAYLQNDQPSRRNFSNLNPINTLTPIIANTASTAKLQTNDVMTTPQFANNLEQKTIEELKDLHVDAVDEEDPGPMSWKNPKTGDPAQ
jgi:hypothetical protein